jgi:WD40 repeat protein
VKDQQQQPPLLTVAPLAVLKGHRSSIFSVRWVGPGDISHLVSASDDRTARVWQVHLQEQHHQQGIQGLNSQGQGEDMQVQGGGAAQPAAILSTSCVAVLTGHTARVWDASLLRLPDNSLVAATGGEDCALRLWVLPSRAAAGAPQLLDGGASNHSGGPDSVNSQQPVSPACAAMLQGHRGRGVWRLALLNSSGGAGAMLVSGGADASIKLWWLPAWLPLTCALQLSTSSMGSGHGSAGTQQEAQAGDATTSKLPKSLMATQASALQRLQLR